MEKICLLILVFQCYFIYKDIHINFYHFYFLVSFVFIYIVYDVFVSIKLNNTDKNQSTQRNK